VIDLNIEDYCIRAKIEMNLQASFKEKITYLPGEPALSFDLSKDIES